MSDERKPALFSSAQSTFRRFSAGGSILGWNVVGLLGLLILCSISPEAADAATQTDWSMGEGGPGVVATWDGSFEEAEGISWLAVKGQITLSGVEIEIPVKHVVADHFVRPSSLDPADVDGDGDLDLVGAAIGGSRIRWWRNEGGKPPAWTGVDIEAGFAGAASARAGDIDGDGTVDVAGCAWVENEVAVWYNGGQGVSWTRQSVKNEFAQCHWVDLADLDDDGDLDLLGAAAEANTVAIWYNDGGAPVGWTEQVIDTAYGGARSLVAADLDGDGDLDLLGTALEDDDLDWWRNDGGEPINWTRFGIVDDLAGSHHADAWDMDLDGDLDIVALGYGYPWLKLFWNDGGNPVSWRGEDIGDAIVTPLVLGAGDLDGDGDMDVAATADAWNRVIWWQNAGGPPGDWPSATVASQFPSPWPLAIADFDDNGALDIISGASGGTEVAWWDLTDFVATGFIKSRVLSIPEDVVALECGLDALVPHGTDIEVAIRYGPSPGELGEWTSVDPGRQLAIMARGPVYLQYRLELASSDVAEAPVVRAISFDWNTELPSRSSPGGRVSP